jgi:hypothetical protein
MALCDTAASISGGPEDARRSAALRRATGVVQSGASGRCLRDHQCVDEQNEALEDLSTRRNPLGRRGDGR